MRFDAADGAQKRVPALRVVVLPGERLGIEAQVTSEEAQDVPKRRGMQFIGPPMN